jgi:branched-chain amino acid transport system ATP-binding protein
MTLLAARGLSAGYGQGRVLHGIDVEVSTGGLTAVLGANGAGKTTLLRAICGMVSAHGEVHFEGARIDGLSTDHVARLGIAHVPEGRGTFESLTTEENLRLGGHTRRQSAEVHDALARVYDYFPRLRERRHQQAGTLSGGEQQMLAIGRALMMRPKLLVLDEPSFGLAPLVVSDIFRIVRRINKDDQVGVLLVEANAAIALDLADRACLLETGRVVISGPPDDLRRDESIRRAYLGY